MFPDVPSKLHILQHWAILAEPHEELSTSLCPYLSGSCKVMRLLPASFSPHQASPKSSVFPQYTRMLWRTVTKASLNTKKQHIHHLPFILDGWPYPGGDQIFRTGLSFVNTCWLCLIELFFKCLLVAPILPIFSTICQVLRLESQIYRFPGPLLN